MFKRKYDWEVVIKHYDMFRQTDFVLYISEGYIIQLHLNDNGITISLKISSKSERELEYIKAGIENLGWEIVSVTNKGLTSIPWWENLLDKLIRFTATSKEDKKRSTSKFYK